MARALQKQLIRVQAATFADWCAEVRDLAGERWPEVSDQAPTLYAAWGGGATAKSAPPCEGPVVAIPPLGRFWRSAKFSVSNWYNRVISEPCLWPHT
jgi:hypothetical protein